MSTLLNEAGSKLGWDFDYRPDEGCRACANRIDWGWR
jgi:hypothetical protein